MKPTPKLTDRERAHRERVRADLAAAARRGTRIVIGDPIPIELSTTKRSTVTMNRPVRLAASAKAQDPLHAEAVRRVAERSLEAVRLPPDIPKAIAAITKALGIPADADSNTIAVAIAALLEARDSDPTRPENIEAACRAFGLSARESKMLAQMKVDPRKYVATKTQLGRKPVKR